MDNPRLIINQTRTNPRQGSDEALPPSTTVLAKVSSDPIKPIKRAYHTFCSHMRGPKSWIKTFKNAHQRLRYTTETRVLRAVLKNKKNHQNFAISNFLTNKPELTNIHPKYLSKLLTYAIKNNDANIASLIITKTELKLPQTANDLISLLNLLATHKKIQAIQATLNKSDLSHLLELNLLDSITRDTIYELKLEKSSTTALEEIVKTSSNDHEKKIASKILAFRGIASKQSFSSVKDHIEAFLNTEDTTFNTKDIQTKKTLLISAIEETNPEALKYLLNRGADLFTQDFENKNALFYIEKKKQLLASKEIRETLTAILEEKIKTIYETPNQRIGCLIDHLKNLNKLCEICFVSALKHQDTRNLQYLLNIITSKQEIFSKETGLKILTHTYRTQNINIINLVQEKRLNFILNLENIKGTSLKIKSLPDLDILDLLKITGLIEASRIPDTDQMEFFLAEPYNNQNHTAIIQVKIALLTDVCTRGDNRLLRIFIKQSNFIFNSDTVKAAYKEIKRHISSNPDFTNLTSITQCCDQLIQAGLKQSIMEGNIENTRFFIEKKTDHKVSLSRKFQYQLLILAINSKNNATVETLLASPLRHIRDKEILQKASQKNTTKEIKETIGVFSTDSFNDLRTAIKENNTIKFHNLYTLFINNTPKRTAIATALLHTALAYKVDDDIIMELIKYGVNANWYCYNKTPLIMAIEQGKWKVMNQLLAKGADASLRDKKYDYTPLYYILDLDEIDTTKAFTSFLKHSPTTLHDNLTLEVEITLYNYLLGNKNITQREEKIAALLKIPHVQLSSTQNAHDPITAISYSKIKTKLDQYTQSNTPTNTSNILKETWNLIFEEKIPESIMESNSFETSVVELEQALNKKTPKTGNIEQLKSFFTVMFYYHTSPHASKKAIQFIEQTWRMIQCIETDPEILQHLFLHENNHSMNKELLKETCIESFIKSISSIHIHYDAYNKKTFQIYCIDGQIGRICSTFTGIFKGFELNSLELLNNSILNLIHQKAEEYFQNHKDQKQLLEHLEKQKNQATTQTDKDKLENINKQLQGLNQKLFKYIEAAIIEQYSNDQTQSESPDNKLIRLCVNALIGKHLSENGYFIYNEEETDILLTDNISL